MCQYINQFLGDATKIGILPGRRMEGNQGHLWQLEPSVYLQLKRSPEDIAYHPWVVHQGYRKQRDMIAKQGISHRYLSKK